MKPSILRRFRSLEGYDPVTPPEVHSREAGLSPQEIIKLDGNENPYGPSPKVARALASYPWLHIYPDAQQQHLRKALEGYTGLEACHIVVGAGSDELIDLVCRLFLRRGDGVITCPPTFGMYSFSTRLAGGRVMEVPRRDGFSLDLAGMRKAIDKRTRLLFLASPNNPTGDLVPKEEVLELLHEGLTVVVDEAYYEFSGESVAHLVPSYPNLFVLRTFSKWAGLAGLRVGYGLFPEEVASALMKIKQPYNLNRAAEVAALESLGDLEYLRGRVEAILKERGRLFSRLGKIGFLHPYPSRANFILCRLLKGQALDIQRRLARKGIFVRYFNTPLLRNYLRISVGRPQDTDALISALWEIGGGL